MMPKREVFDAGLRLADLDNDPGALDLLRTASGGYGTKKQQRLVDDLRTLYRHALGDKPAAKAQWPFPPPPGAA